MRPAVEPNLPLHIDSTMLTCFRSCPQKFYNEFVLGLRAGKSIDLHAGGAFSSTLETFYRRYWSQVEPRNVERAQIAAARHFIEYWGAFESNKPNSPKTKETIWSAIESYIDHYPPHSDHIQPYMVEGQPTFEFSFAIPLEGGFPVHPSGQPFVFCGRPDLLGHWNGKTIIRDEKTSGRLDTKWSEQWDLRSQFMGYVWAAQQMGLVCDTVSVRGVIITKTQPTRFPEAFKMYSKYDIDRWHLQLQRDLWRIRQCWDGQYWDYNFGETCTQYGMCPYMGMCKSPQPENWYSQFEVSRWNPLAINPADGDSTPTSSASASERKLLEPISTSMENPSLHNAQ